VAGRYELAIIGGRGRFVKGKPAKRLRFNRGQGSSPQMTQFPQMKCGEFDLLLSAHPADDCGEWSDFARRLVGVRAECS
jgi:hypothetical protein